MKNEYIIASAIWYKDLPSQDYLPINIGKGILVLGHRHHNCINLVKHLSGLRTVKLSPDGVGDTIQGFLTNLNRFVDRLGMKIAISSNQVEMENLSNPMIGLFSEDLW